MHQQNLAQSPQYYLLSVLMESIEKLVREILIEIGQVLSSLVCFHYFYLNIPLRIHNQSLNLLRLQGERNTVYIGVW